MYTIPRRASRAFNMDFLKNTAISMRHARFPVALRFTNNSAVMFYPFMRNCVKMTQQLIRFNQQ